MPITAIEGIVESGRIRLRDGVTLPENTKVYVIVAEQDEGLSARIRSPHLAHPEQAGDFRKKIVELSDDAKI